MTKLEQAARQALEALKWSAPMGSTREAKQQYIEAYAALRDALAEQAEQEPEENKIYTQAELDAAVLAEREACAKVCDAVLGENNVSAAIRARSKK